MFRFGDCEIPSCATIIGKGSNPTYICLQIQLSTHKRGSPCGSCHLTDSEQIVFCDVEQYIIYIYINIYICIIYL